MHLSCSLSFCDDFQVNNKESKYVYKEEDLQTSSFIFLPETFFPL